MNFQDKDIYVSRKTFLKGLAGLSLFPFLEANASAVKKNPHKRLLLISGPFGMVPQYFKPRESGANYTAPKVLKTIDHLRKYFTVFSNLEHSGVGNGHESVHAYLSGISRGQMKSFPNCNQTIDQLIGDQLGGYSRFPVLNLGVGGLCEQTSWNSKGIHIRPMTDMRGIFKKLFVNQPVAVQKQQKQLIDDNLDLLNVLGKQANIFKNKISVRDQEKLQEYNYAIQSLQKKMYQLRKWQDVPKPKVGMNEPGDLSFGKAFPIFLEMSYLALYTNSTRVISIEIPKTLKVSSLGVEGGGYHYNTHHGRSPEKLKNMYMIESFYLKQLGRLIKKMSKAQDPEGEGTMLDNTMILFGSGMSNSNSHSNRNLPVLLAGGGLKHGQHRKYDKPVEFTNLLLTIALKLGISIDQFNTSTGTLDI